MKLKTLDEKRREFWKERLDAIANKLDSLLNELDNLANAIEGNVMKKTTQRSSEWFGGANC